MNIYLVERTDRWGYDDYDRFVCIAETAEDAKKMHPCNSDLDDDMPEFDYYWKENGWYHKFRDGKEYGPEKYHSWVDDLDYLKVRMIGTTDCPDIVKPKIVLASFNAG